MLMCACNKCCDKVSFKIMLIVSFKIKLITLFVMVRGVNVVSVCYHSPHSHVTHLLGSAIGHAGRLQPNPSRLGCVIKIADSTQRS